MYLISYGVRLSNTVLPSFIIVFVPNWHWHRGWVSIGKRIFPFRRPIYLELKGRRAETSGRALELKADKFNPIANLPCMFNPTPIKIAVASLLIVQLSHGRNIIHMLSNSNTRKQADWSIRNTRNWYSAFVWRSRTIYNNIKDLVFHIICMVGKRVCKL